MSALLQTIDDRGVATLTLNNPDRHNAFDDVLIDELTAALRRLDVNPSIRVVVLASTGRSFSAGADIGWMQRMAQYSEAENVADARALAELLHVLDRLTRPTVAVVQGPAYGGGVGLVACCDIALASERATFRLSEVRLGLTPATISPYVVGAIGTRQARRFFQTAETFDAAEARRFGLVHEVVADDMLPPTRDRIIGELLQGGPEAVAQAKSLVFLAQSGHLDEAMMAETSRRIAARRASTEGQEGLAAFLHKRGPPWRNGAA